MGGVVFKIVPPWLYHFLKSGRLVLLNDEVLDWFPEISEKKFEKVENFRSKSNYQISHMVKRLAQKPILTPILKG